MEHRHFSRIFQKLKICLSFISSKGICKKCEEINQGCLDCHYDNNYPEDYKGLKRKRRFICDKCETI